MFVNYLLISQSRFDLKLEFAVLNSYRWAHNVSLCVEGWEPQLLIKFTDGDQQGFKKNKVGVMHLKKTSRLP